MWFGRGGPGRGGPDGPLKAAFVAWGAPLPPAGRERVGAAVPGHTLVFRNDDDGVHQIEGTFGEPFKSKKLEKGHTFELKMDNTENGDGISFRCPLHPETSKMTGTVAFSG